MQHILFATDLNGDLIEGTQLKHQGDDWEYEPSFIYDFTGPLTWAVKRLPAGSGEWVRRITNLDDGLRYQCAAPWKINSEYAEWTCGNNYAPIPGRETRDMGRKDYNTLMRSTRIVNYGASWLERQDNVKTIDANGTRTPLARELGKNWYVRLPDSECAAAHEFMKDKLVFWDLLRTTWDQILIGDRPFIEIAVAPGKPNRYMEMFMVEDKYQSLDLKDAKIRKSAQDEIVSTIKKFRAN